MNRLSKTAIVVFGALLLIASGCGKKEESSQQRPNQGKASQQTKPESPNTPKQEATTAPKKEVKANSVQIAYMGGTKVIGEIRFKLGPGLIPGQGEAQGPVKVMIFREIAPKRLETAKQWGVKVGGAYIQKGPAEYEYIRDVDLALSDEELAEQFGVESK
jgi:hypothetical protein